MPISEDMFFSAASTALLSISLLKDSELRVIDSVSGHLGFFGLEPDMEQIDRNLGELLGTKV